MTISIPHVIDRKPFRDRFILSSSRTTEYKKVSNQVHELTSKAIAMSQSSSIATPEKRTTLTTTGLPTVSVPVLSNTTALTYRDIIKINATVEKCTFLLTSEHHKVH